MEQAAEVVRNGAGGTKRAWETRGWWTPAADVAKGGETPRKEPEAAAEGRLTSEEFSVGALERVGGSTRLRKKAGDGDR